MGAVLARAFYGGGCLGVTWICGHLKLDWDCSTAGQSGLAAGREPQFLVRNPLWV